MQTREDNHGGAGPGKGGRRTRSRRPQREAFTGGGAGQQSCVTQGAHASLADVESQVRQAPPASAERHHFMEFTVELPFLPYLDSRLATHCLRMVAQTVREPVHVQFSISGSDVFLQMHSVDVNALRTSTSSLLRELFLLTETMKHIMPPAHGRLTGLSRLSPE